MNASIKMVMTLTLIAVLSGAVLSAWDSFTKPKVAAHKLRELKAAISEVLPEYDNYEEIKLKDRIVYMGTSQDSVIGIAFKVSGSGFQGTIDMMLGMTPDFSNITGLKILDQIETPGLGTKIVDDPSNKTDSKWFTNQFQKLTVFPEITTVKNKKPQTPTEIQAITGATISSVAIVRILNININKVKTDFEANRNRTN